MVKVEKAKEVVLVPKTVEADHCEPQHQVVDVPIDDHGDDEPELMGKVTRAERLRLWKFRRLSVVGLQRERVMD